MQTFFKPAVKVAPAPKAISKGKYNSTTKGSDNQFHFENGMIKARHNNMDRPKNPSLFLMIQLER
jgi:hypothetical protein